MARGSKEMSPVAQALCELALRKPLTFELCTKADRLAESIESPEKRRRAYDFVQKFMWDRLPKTQPPSKSATTRASKPAAKRASRPATRAAKQPETRVASTRASRIDDFGHAYGEYLQDPKPLNLSKAQAMYIKALEGGETHSALYDWAQEIGDRVLMETWVEERGNYWQPRRA